jgi:hypothetical protein
VLQTRHFGRDAEIQAMEGKVPVLQMFDLIAPMLLRSPLYTSLGDPSFRRGLPESSHREVNLRVGV